MYEENIFPKKEVLDISCIRSKLKHLVLIIVIIQATVCADLNSLVNCDYSSQDIRLVLKDLAEQAKVNMIVDDNLQRRVSLKLEEVPFQSVLQMFQESFSIEVKMSDDIIVATQKDQYSANSQVSKETSSAEIIQIGSVAADDVIRILKSFSCELQVTVFEDQDIIVVSGPYSKVNLAKNAISTWLGRQSLGESLRYEVVKLNYIEPQDLAYITSLAPGVRISAMNNLKTVVISGSKNDVEAVVHMVKDLDRPPKVVQISVEMLEVSQGDLEDIGLSLKGNNGYNSLSIKWDEQAVQQNPWKGGEEDEELNLFEFIKLRPWIRASLSLITEVNLLVEEGKARVLARPSLTTLENKTAKIHTGERYSLVLYQNNYQQLQYIDIGVQLEITPRVDDAGNITAIVSPQVSAITGFSKEGYPRIATRQVSTTVRVKNGETLVIGGLVKESETANKHGIPLLSELPVLRLIFGNSSEQVEKSELIILVTFNSIDVK